MSDGAGGRSSWSRYIDDATRRPGWNAAKLARESGIHRSTIFRWKSGGGSGVTVDSVRRIAVALGDDIDEALRAAGELVADVQPEDDEEVALIMHAPVGDDLKQVMLSRLRVRRERDRQQRMEDFQQMIDFARRED